MTVRCRRTLVLALAMFAALAAAPAVAAEPSRAVAVMYHRFGEDGIPATNIRMEQFQAHIAELNSGGYMVMPLPDVVDALKQGRPLPDKTLVITVDDAYASVYDKGWPLLREAGLPMTLFVSTEPVGRPGYMTWDQIREMQAAGVTIAAHMHSHPHMPDMTPDQQAADMETSLEIFEKELGARPRLFAYPFGEADEAAIELTREHGFDAAFGQHSGALVSGEDMLYLPRFALNESYGALERFQTVADALPIPASDVLPKNPTLASNNPPAFGFTVADESLSPDGIACYGPGGEPVAVEVLGPRVEVRFADAFPPGRARVNCTMAGPTGDDGQPRWQWRGFQFVVPDPA